LYDKICCSAKSRSWFGDKWTHNAQMSAHLVVIGSQADMSITGFGTEAVIRQAGAN
jgi:hypothetical protein